MTETSPQPFRIETGRDGGLLRCELQGGDGGFEALMTAWRAIAEAVVASRAREVLVVDRMDGDSVGPELQQRLVREMVGAGLGGVRIAYVARARLGFGSVEHAEILAREGGFDVRAFDTEHDAVTWLRHGMR